MSLSKASLKARLEEAVKAQGFVLDNPHSETSKFLDAIANAVVDEIQQNAVVKVTSGSSAGSYPVS